MFHCLTVEKISFKAKSKTIIPKTDRKCSLFIGKRDNLYPFVVSHQKMLRPTKHSHPDQTVISLSYHLLLILRKQRIMGFEKLRDFAKDKIIGGEVLFMPSLNFLYTLGVIEYHKYNDSIEYLGS